MFTFNVGGELRHIVEIRRKLNDGKYHYVQFTRTGSSATLRVDDLPPKSTAASSSGQLSLSSFCSSRLQLDVRNLSLGRRHLVNAYEVKAGMV